MTAARDALAPGERRLSTPLVLAGSSTMICVGLAAWWLAARPGGPGAGVRAEEKAAAPEAALELGSAEATAETFLDAWRKRDHRVARALSVGEARDAVAARAAEDAALGDDARAAAALWGMLAGERLAFVPSAVETLDPTPSGGERLRLAGTAEGTFFEHPYKRRVTFEVRRAPGGDDASIDARGERVAAPWRVERMVLGDQLVVPPALRQLGELDPETPR